MHYYICCPAQMAKLVDALCSGRSVRKDVLVRIQFWAQNHLLRVVFLCSKVNACKDLAVSLSGKELEKRNRTAFNIKGNVSKKLKIIAATGEDMSDMVEALLETYIAIYQK